MAIKELNGQQPNPTNELEITVLGNPISVSGWGNIIAVTQDSIRFVPSGSPVDSYVYGFDNLMIGNSRSVQSTLVFTTYTVGTAILDFSIYTGNPWNTNIPIDNYASATKIDMSGQHVYRDGRWHPANGLQFGFDRSYPDTDGGLVMTVINNNTNIYPAKAIPVGWMSTDQFALLQTTLYLSTDAKISTDGAGIYGTYIFLTSAYVNPAAPLTPNQLINQARQAWTS